MNAWVCAGINNSARVSSLGLKAALVALHVVYVGVVFVFDEELKEKTKQKPWYISMYVSLFVLTLGQYFITSGSSPGYVHDAMRAFVQSYMVKKQPGALIHTALGNNQCITINMDDEPAEKDTAVTNSFSWTKLILALYPPGTSLRTLKCSYCNVEQPPRAKHCHDCDKCVLQFDHHCVWLGTCIGQGNHCRFWWYICEESAVCLWTIVLYISFLKSSLSRTWWKNLVVALLLVSLFISFIFLLLLLLFHSYLILTNQTTYELVRRRRISYLRGVPERVYPFSKGICSNVYGFCWGNSIYNLEQVPPALELEEKARPYKCADICMCRCC